MGNGSSDLADATLRGAAWVGASRFGGKLLFFVSTLLLARLLSQEDFGVAAYAITLITLFSSVPGLGLVTVYVLDLPHGRRYLTEQDASDLGLDAAGTHRLALENLRQNFPREMVTDALAGDGGTAVAGVATQEHHRLRRCGGVGHDHRPRRGGRRGCLQ